MEAVMGLSLARRGLYSLVDWNLLESISDGMASSRGLYSLVDWNMPAPGRALTFDVEAYTASWIEISLALKALKVRQSRGLYSLVDWNKITGIPHPLHFMSRLIQPRGLKFLIQYPLPVSSRRGLYSLVDWNLRCFNHSLGYNVEAYTASWIEI